MLYTRRWITIHGIFYMHTFFYLFFVFLGAIGFFVSAVPAHALVLSPTVLEYEVAKGSVVSHSVRLKNDSSSSVTLMPTIYAVSGQDEHGFPEFSLPSDDSPLKQWISLGTAGGVTIDAGKEVDISILVSIPSQAASGGYYATVTWSAKREGGSVGLVPSPGVNIAIDVPGPVTEKASITQFVPRPQKGFGLSLPITFLIKVRNDGGAHFAPRGTIEIRNIFGSTVGHVPVTTQEGAVLLDANQKNSNGNVLPGATRTVYGVWGGIFAFGPYTATLSLDTHGAGTLSAQKKFFVTSPVLTYIWYAVLSLCIVFLLRFILTLIRVVYLKK